MSEQELPKLGIVNVTQESDGWRNCSIRPNMPVLEDKALCPMCHKSLEEGLVLESTTDNGFRLMREGESMHLDCYIEHCIRFFFQVEKELMREEFFQQAKKDE